MEQVRAMEKEVRAERGIKNKIKIKNKLAIAFLYFDTMQGITD
jgi:hypothetical protein